MNDYISFDSHKHYTLAERENVINRPCEQTRIPHRPGAIREYLQGVAPGTVVAVEAMGYWYWIVDEIEASGCLPALVHPYKSKVMLGCINKSDKLDVHGLNRLQRAGTLPTVWIPPAAIRDQRDLPRVRMFLTRERGRLKNRIHSQLAKYGVIIEGYSDLFGVGGLEELKKQIVQLPPCAREVTQELLAQLEFVEEQIAREERRIMEVVRETPDMVRLMTLPGVGKILAIIIALEIGAISRFRRAGQCASYAGTTPRIHASGDKIRYGKMRSDVNRYLKWAFMEAANSVCRHKRRLPHRHVAHIYARIKSRKGHGKAIGAVARHLAEATFYMLSKGEDYKEPNFKRNGLIQGNVSAK